MFALHILCVRPGSEVHQAIDVLVFGRLSQPDPHVLSGSSWGVSGVSGNWSNFARH